MNLIGHKICQNGNHINGNDNYEVDDNDDVDDYTELHHDLSTVHELDSHSIESEQTMNTTRVLTKKITTTPNGIIHIYHTDNSHNNNSNNTTRHQKHINNYVDNDEVIDDMDDDINCEDQSINELDITDESIYYEPYSRSQINVTLGKRNQLNDTLNKRSSKSHTTLNNANWKVLKPNKSKDYVLAVSPRPPLPRNIQTYNHGSYPSRREHSHANEFHSNVNGGREGIGGGNNGPFDYWTIPRNSQPHYKIRSSENKEFYMPGNLFLNEKSLPRSRRKGHRNVREKSEAILSGSGNTGKHHNRRNSAKPSDKVESTGLTQNKNDIPNVTDSEKCRSELKSELERYKALVRMLRFENAEYQARVANLVQLLEQMSTNVSNASTVQSLVQQVNLFIYT
ncbi:unnamed protein product [Schistosoma mattheei]|uniref:Uncharacterized protein n=1 Tax=Schistosoma mattheei TaxID=31246 RepID=A0A183NYL4_9TREM|nr:unnamed protein product [Schistosoma mattheei]